MTDAKHTPGPWEIESPTMAGSHRLVVGAYGFGSICAVSLDGAPRHQSRLPADSPYYAQQIPTMAANARLIAAAPELLSSGADILPAFETLCKAQDIDLSGDSLFASVYRNLLSAIAKAKGD